MVEFFENILGGKGPDESGRMSVSVGAAVRDRTWQVSDGSERQNRPGVDNHLDLRLLVDAQRQCKGIRPSFDVRRELSWKARLDWPSGKVVVPVLRQRHPFQDAPRRETRLRPPKGLMAIFDLCHRLTRANIKIGTVNLVCNMRCLGLVGRESRTRMTIGCSGPKLSELPPLQIALESDVTASIGSESENYPVERMVLLDVHLRGGNEGD